MLSNKKHRKSSSTFHLNKLLSTTFVQKQVLKNFEYVYKLVVKNRELIREARSTNLCAHFDITKVTRSEEWWLEYIYGELDNAQDELTITSCAGLERDKDHVTDEDITQVETFLWSTVICHDDTRFEDENTKPLWSRCLQSEGGQSPQISFLAELCESEVISVMQLCCAWIQNRGLTNRAGQWIYCLLALLKHKQHEQHEQENKDRACKALAELVNDLNRLRLSLLMGPVKALKNQFQDKHQTKKDATKKKCEQCAQIEQFRVQFTLLYLILFIVFGWQ